MADRDLLAEANEKMLFLDGPEFDRAIIGTAQRCGQPTLVVYDRELVLDVLVKDHGLSYEDAVEWYEFNIVGAWHGEHTPLFFSKIEEG